ncbi:MAG: NusG domain II-containing protein [Gammaproteobacteria bacterium]|nr:NusG domain II-containing protein [Gammaproteobacteria bacterium]
MWRPGDVLVVLAGAGLVLGLAVGIYSNDRIDSVHIVSHSHGPLDLPAWQETRLDIEGPLGTTSIEVDGGRARIVSSPCRQKLCIKRGWLTSAGATVACLPNRVSVSLQGADADIDALAF